MNCLLCGSFVWSCGACAPLGGGSQSQSKHHRDSLTCGLQQADLAEAAMPFRFEWYEGNVLDGFNSVVIDSTGVVRVVTRAQVSGPSSVVPPHKTLELRIDVSDLNAVRRELAEIRFPSLKPVYRNQRLRDGTRILARLTMGSKQKVVCCDNEFPDGIRAVRRLLYSTILAPYGKAVELSGSVVSVEDTRPPFEVAGE